MPFAYALTGLLECLVDLGCAPQSILVGDANAEPDHMDVEGMKLLKARPLVTAFATGMAAVTVSLVSCLSLWPGLPIVMFWHAEPLVRNLVCVCAVNGVACFVHAQLVCIRCAGELVDCERSVRIALLSLEIFGSIALTPVLMHFAVHHYYVKMLVYGNNCLLCWAVSGFCNEMNDNRDAFISFLSQSRQRHLQIRDRPPDAISQRSALEQAGQLVDDISLACAGAGNASHAVAANTSSRVCAAFSVTWSLWIPTAMVSKF